MERHIKSMEDKCREASLELVEENNGNYNLRSFRTSCDYEIVAEPNIQLSDVNCLMVKELVPGALNGVGGSVDFSF